MMTLYLYYSHFMSKVLPRVTEAQQGQEISLKLLELAGAKLRFELASAESPLGFMGLKS